MDAVDTLPSPLRHPPIARAVAIVLALVLAFAALVLIAVILGLGPAGRAVFFQALAYATLLAVPPVTILWYLDRREREAPSLYLAAFLWGGLIATMLALPFNTAAILAIGAWLEGNEAVRMVFGPEAALVLGAPLAAPLTEEIAKGLGVVLLFLGMRHEFDNVRDGIVYGALVGVGFNWFESALYVAQNFLQFGAAPFGFQLGARHAWLGLGGHALFSGIFGALLGLARATSRTWVRWLAPVTGLMLAIAAHAWNNSLPLIAFLLQARAGEAPPTTVEPPPDLGLVDAMVGASLSNAILFLPFVVLGWVLLRRSGEAERRVIREELATEVGAAVTPEEYDAVIADRRYRTRRVARGGAAAKALVNAQNELAFRKRRVRDRGGDPERDTWVLAWRAEVDRQRVSLARALT
jgi:RsiW-degrading membrane proteinase PrsW (M82 family)